LPAKALGVIADEIVGSPEENIRRPVVQSVPGVRVIGLEKKIGDGCRRPGADNVFVEFLHLW